jgi:quercetin dioxygenase-like cupin family protein
MEERMSPVHRSLAGDVLALDLGEEMQLVRGELASGHARIARTLVKEGPLRLTLVGLGPGGVIREHEADGPVTIHVLDGELELNAGGETRAHRVGALIALDRRVRHAISSPRGALFLLTLAAPTEDVKEVRD